MARRSDIDWERIQRLYVAGQLTIRQIADECGVSDSQVRAKAKKEGWARGCRGHLHVTRPVDRVGPVPLHGNGVSDVADGFIYVFYVEAGIDRFYKIGRAKDPIQRKAQHQTSLPLNLMVACCYFTPSVVGEERFLHSMFAEKRVRGEWFALIDADLDVIAARSRLV